MTAIEVQGVTRRFDEVMAVDDVTLSIAHGEIVGLLGHNGAGKTTLLRVINGLLQPDEGSVTVMDRNPMRDGAFVRRHTGVLTEYPALDEFLTTRENLEVYASINGIPRRAARPRIDDLMARLDLAEKADTVTRGLSAGLKQRVALARGLVHEPTLLLLDEPTTNMDPVAARSVRSLIVDAVAHHGRTVLLSTHNLVEAEELCDRVAIMRNGRLLAVGAPAELRRELTDVTGVTVRTTPDDAPRVAGLLGQGFDVRQPAADTVEVHGPSPVPAVVERLATAGVAIHAVQPLEPSLEDLYVALHREEVHA